MTKAAAPSLSLIDANILNKLSFLERCFGRNMNMSWKAELNKNNENYMKFIKYMNSV